MRIMGSLQIANANLAKEIELRKLRENNPKKYKYVYIRNNSMRLGKGPLKDFYEVHKSKDKPTAKDIVEISEVSGYWPK